MALIPTRGLTPPHVAFFFFFFFCFFLCLPHTSPCFLNLFFFASWSPVITSTRPCFSFPARAAFFLPIPYVKSDHGPLIAGLLRFRAINVNLSLLEGPRAFFPTHTEGFVLTFDIVLGRRRVQSRACQSVQQSAEFCRCTITEFDAFFFKLDILGSSSRVVTLPREVPLPCPRFCDAPFDPPSPD